MILERKTRFNIPDLKEQQELIFQHLHDSESEDHGVSLMEFAEFIQMYNGAMKCISTKLEVLDDSFQFIVGIRE